ncbi:4300_t:CDS:10 [Ambispora leptoticha]|uniref:Class E vacuolar protein-sorting machinery protein HSE1 n=1 Tax=Ambispora leptoticha TaxID=144679 RepID=A0A9N8WBP9_9GLOM|nr:4300_t:CDS:10 [Ambispora leptoticha]
MFRSTNSFEEVVAKATDETLTSENWELITNICEKVEAGGEKSARECIEAIQKRLAHRAANVQLYSLTLSNSLVRSCGLPLHREICSRTFTSILARMVTDKNTHETVKNRITELIQDWTFEFRSNSSLSLMEETFNQLRAQGVPFLPPDKPKKEPTQSELDKQKEEDDFQLAIAMSLSQTVTPKERIVQRSPPSQKAVVKQDATPKQPPPASKVRSLYDFTPTEPGELGFSRGDVITVLETVYKDWWRGELNGKTGIFPVNYVEKITEPSPADLAREAEIEASVFAEARNVERLLELLSTIDPTKDSFSENEAIQNLYHSTLAVRPKLVQLIEKYSQKKDELIALNDKFNTARTTYDRLLEESINRYKPNATVGGPSALQQQQQYAYQQQQPPPVGYAPQQPPSNAGYQQQQPQFANQDGMSQQPPSQQHQQQQQPYQQAQFTQTNQQPPQSQQQYSTEPQTFIQQTPSLSSSTTANGINPDNNIQQQQPNKFGGAFPPMSNGYPNEQQQSQYQQSQNQQSQPQYQQIDQQPQQYQQIDQQQQQTQQPQTPQQTYQQLQTNNIRQASLPLLPQQQQQLSYPSHQPQPQPQSSLPLHPQQPQQPPLGTTHQVPQQNVAPGYNNASIVQQQQQPQQYAAQGY